jgi:hypothetical protein
VGFIGDAPGKGKPVVPEGVDVGASNEVGRVALGNEAEGKDEDGALSDEGGALGLSREGAGVGVDPIKGEGNVRFENGADVVGDNSGPEGGMFGKEAAEDVGVNLGPEVEAGT